MARLTTREAENYVLLGYIDTLNSSWRNKSAGLRGSDCHPSTPESTAYELYFPQTNHITSQDLSFLLYERKITVKGQLSQFPQDFPANGPAGLPKSLISP